MPLRTTRPRKRSSNATWARLWRAHADEFLKEMNDERERSFRTLADALRRYTAWWLNNDKWHEFGAALPRVLGHCDEPIYDDMATVLAYAHVHLLERYLRFWEVARQLVTAHVLPLRAKGVSVLDVGIGPAPASYVMADVYRALNQFAAARGLAPLQVPVRIECIDSGAPMSEFLHGVSEYSLRREGPFRVDLRDFGEFDPRARRARDLKSRRAALEDEGVGDPNRWIQENEPYLHESWHYDICIFSNFFTRPERLAAHATSVGNVFGAMRPGGLVVVVGGAGGQYPALYERIDALAVRAGARRVGVDIGDITRLLVSGRRFIKSTYDQLWGDLRERVGPEKANRLARNIPSEAKELFDPAARYRAPSTFGLRVYRKQAPRRRKTKPRAVRLAPAH